MVLEAALGGLGGFEGPRSSIGEFIRSKLAEAKQKGLLKFQSDAQTQGAMNLAQSKSDIAGDDTFNVFQTDPSGVASPVATAEGQTDFSKGTKIFTPSEGATEGERNLASAKAQMKADIFSQMNAGDGNVIEQSAGASATPISNIVNQQEQPVQPQQVGLSPEEQELIKALEALGG